MTAEQAVKTIEGLVSHYKKNMPEHIKQVEEAIEAIKDYIRYSEGHMASGKLDVIASQIEEQSPIIAMAIDKISDILDKNSSYLLVQHVLKDLWDLARKNKNKFLELLKAEFKTIQDAYPLSDIEKAMDKVTGGQITLDMIKTAGFLVESDLMQNIKQTWDVIRKQIIEANPRERMKKIIKMLSEKIKPVLDRYLHQKRIPELADALQKATGGTIGISPAGTLTILKAE